MTHTHTAAIIAFLFTRNEMIFAVVFTFHLTAKINFNILCDYTFQNERSERNGRS
jgi:hypothetical protein